MFLAFFFYYVTLSIPNVNTKLKGRVRKYIPYVKFWAIIASNNSYLVEWLKHKDQSGAIKMWGNTYQLLYTVRYVIAQASTDGQRNGVRS